MSRVFRKWWMLLVLLVVVVGVLEGCGRLFEAKVYQCICVWRCVDGSAPSFEQGQVACGRTALSAERDAEWRCKRNFPEVKSCLEGRCSCSRCQRNSDVACYEEYPREDDTEPR